MLLDLVLRLLYWELVPARILVIVVVVHTVSFVIHHPVAACTAVSTYFLVAGCQSDVGIYGVL